jgi:hypothetical protein
VTQQDQLTVGGLHVGTLTWTGGDFPWAHGTFTPGPHAALLSAFFVVRTDGRSDLDLDALAATEPVMLDPETYLHALVVSPDGTAAWRIGVDPLD